MNRALTDLQQALAAKPAVLVRVTRTQGSAPREAGAWMAVFADRCINTIGGGHIEFEAITQARAMLAGGTVPPDPVRYALGPSLGQCCGGVVYLQYEPLGAHNGASLPHHLQPALTPVALFGGGHVGHALAQVLAPLPMQLRWIDSRDAVFPANLPPNLTCEHSEPVQDAVRDLPANCAVLIMSFSHAEDLEILAQCLQRARAQDELPYIGLIGSKSKWAAFRHRLEARGFNEADFARVTCPIGVPGIPGKQPEVIAVAVAAQLLQRLPS